MRALAAIHRWCGAVFGLLLAVLALTGTLLLWQPLWIDLPTASVSGPADLAAATARMSTVARLGSITFADADMPLHRLSLSEEAGAYAAADGRLLTQWQSVWERPELWLFDLHHSLLAGRTGTLVTGWLGLLGIGFVCSGLLLWWRGRRRLRPRIWPRRMSRGAIVAHHRDLGVLVALPLLISFATGAMLVLRPMSEWLLAPLSGKTTIAQMLAPPAQRGGPLAADLDWARLFATAARLFPDAQPRVLIFPRKPGDLLALRLKQPAEWLPNGRTTLWFDAATGRLVEARDALHLEPAARLFNSLYPLHAAKVGGPAARLLMTAGGVGLMVLGTLAVIGFWRARRWRPAL